MTEGEWDSEEVFEIGGDEVISEEEQMFELMLEIVTGDVFTEELAKFAEKHGNKFLAVEDTNPNGECSHEEFELFQQYRRLIEDVIDREMTDQLNRPFSCASLASKFNNKDALSFGVFEEVADVLNSLNDFLAFKAEMVAYVTSKDKQDLVVLSNKLCSSTAFQPRSQRIRNCN